MEALPPNLRRFSVAEYLQICAQDVLPEDDNFELLDGFIYQRMNRGPLHDSMMTQAANVLMNAVADGWHVRTRSSVVTADSVPQPDVTIARGVFKDYIERYPEAVDTGLLIEVAHGSLKHDRSRKGAVYASGGFRLYWIINLVDRRIEVHSHPTKSDTGSRYSRWETFEVGQHLPVVEGVLTRPIAVSEFVPAFDEVPPMEPPAEN